MRFLRPITEFLKHQAASSILLLMATFIALVWANSPWATSYHQLWHAPLTIGFGTWSNSQSLHFWINEGLMTLFFLLVGLEIKRELLVGELSTPRQAALPIAAALGGMLVPALFYLAIHPLGTAFSHGWGIPTVTDIAFAIGVLTVLGNRVPLGLKVFLTALAIVDDVGAILLIALFYSQGIHWLPLGLAVGLLMVIFIFNRLNVDSPLVYLLLGSLLWLAMLNSGLHATLAGVLLALMIPAQGQINPAEFLSSGQHYLQRFSAAGVPDGQRHILTNEEHQASIQGLESLCEALQAPLQQLEHALHPWVSYVILPLFALANAGITFDFMSMNTAITHPVTLAIMAGLLIGKPSGITGFAWLAVKLKLGELPQQVNWSAIAGAGMLGGIGFTVALFISPLAFGSPDLIDSAKLGILLASILAAIMGTVWLWSALRLSK